VIKALIEDRFVRLAVIVGLAALLLLVLVYIPALDLRLNPRVRPLLRYVVLLAYAILGTWMGAVLWNSFEPGEVLRAIWGYLALSLLLWTMAESISAYYELVLRVDIPFPSLADALWLLGYIPLFAGLFLRFRSLGVPLRVSQIARSFLPFLIVAVPGFILIILPILVDVSSGSLAERLISAAYPVGDLLVVLGALLSVLALAGGALGRMWLIVAAGFLVVTASDLLFSYASWYELYTYSSPVNLITAITDITYVASYILIGVGVLGQARLHHAI